MSLFHDDPFDNVDEISEEQPEVQQDEENHVEATVDSATLAPADVTADVANDEVELAVVPDTTADSTIDDDVVRDRKRPREPTPEKEHHVLNATLDAYEKQQTEATIATLTASLAMKQQLLEGSEAQRILETQNANVTIEALRSQLVRCQKDTTELQKAASSTSVIPTYGGFGTAEYLALSTAEREARQRCYWEARCASLECLLDWQQRTAKVWKTAYESALRTTIHERAIDALPALASEPCALADSSTKVIAENMENVERWLTATFASSDSAEPAPSLGTEQAQQLVTFIAAIRQRVVELGKAHDTLALSNSHAEHELTYLRGVLNTTGAHNIESRIALMREVVERQVSSNLPTPSEVSLRSQLQEAQQRTNLLEAVVASFVHKAEHLPNPQAVVPHVLKEKVARCEVLEREVNALRAEVTALQRLVAVEGTDISTVITNPTDWSPSEHSKEMLLERIAHQWLRRAQEATNRLVSSNGRAAMEDHAIFMSGQHIYSTHAARVQGMLIEKLQSCNAVLRAQLSACSATTRVAVAMVDPSGASLEVENVLQLIDDRAKDAIASNTVAEETVVSAVCDAVVDMQASLSQHMATVKTLIEPSEFRHRSETAFLLSALQAADAAICEALDISPAPLSMPVCPHRVVDEAPVSLITAVSPVTIDTAVATLKEAFQEQLQQLTSQHNAAVSKYTDRWNWLMSQAEHNPLKLLVDARAEMDQLRATVHATEERASSAMKEVKNTAALQQRLQERDEKVKSLEEQVKVTVAQLSKTRKELLAANEVHAATIAAHTATTASLQQRIADVEMQLVAATAVAEATVESDEVPAEYDGTLHEGHAADGEADAEQFDDNEEQLDAQLTANDAAIVDVEPEAIQEDGGVHQDEGGNVLQHDDSTIHREEDGGVHEDEDGGVSGEVPAEEDVEGFDHEVNEDVVHDGNPV